MRPLHPIMAGGAIAALAGAWAQPVAQRTLSDTARAPCSVTSGRPCHPTFCDVFHHGPCFPEYLPPIGQDLQLTIESTDDSKTRTGARADAKPERDHDLDSIGDMYAALRACWVPPAKDRARPGMQYSVRFSFRRDGTIIAAPRMTFVSHDSSAQVRDVYRDAINQALDRCAPMHFTKGMGGAIAGRPIAIRFVDNRTIENMKGQQ